MNSYKYILIIMTITITTTMIVQAGNYRIPWQGVVQHPLNRSNVFDADINVNITENSTQKMIYNKTFYNRMRLFPNNKTGFDIILGEDDDLGLEYNVLYNVCFTIQEESQGCFPWKPGLGNISGDVINPRSINTSHVQWEEFDVGCGNITGATGDPCNPGGGSGGAQWDISSSNYLINISSILDINETKLNLTINDLITSNNDSRNYVYNGTDWLGMRSSSEGILQLQVVDVISDAFNFWSKVGDVLTYMGGKVAIGSSTGGSMLTVQGTVNISSNFNVSGQITMANYSICDLESDADGNLVCGTDEIGGSSMTPTNYLGSDLSGSSGDLNRTLSVTVTMVSVDNAFLHPDFDYNTSAGNIRFNNPVWDDMRITIWNNAALGYSNYLGADFSGGSGEVGRGLVRVNVTQVVVDNSFLHPSVDYNHTGTNLSLVNPLWDDMRVTVWS